MPNFGRLTLCEPPAADLDKAACSAPAAQDSYAQKGSHSTYPPLSVPVVACPFGCHFDTSGIFHGQLFIVNASVSHEPTAVCCQSQD